jgi:hypothetical protein
MYDPRSETKEYDTRSETKEKPKQRPVPPPRPPKTEEEKKEEQDGGETERVVHDPGDRG